MTKQKTNKTQMSTAYGIMNTKEKANLEVNIKELPVCIICQKEIERMYIQTCDIKGINTKECYLVMTMGLCKDCKNKVENDIKNGKFKLEFDCSINSINEIEK